MTRGLDQHSFKFENFPNPSGAAAGNDPGELIISGTNMLYAGTLIVYYDAGASRLEIPVFDVHNGTTIGVINATLEGETVTRVEIPNEEFHSGVYLSGLSVLIPT